MAEVIYIVSSFDDGPLKAFHFEEDATQFRNHLSMDEDSGYPFYATFTSRLPIE
jgi:hypothetical protein